MSISQISLIPRQIFSTTSGSVYKGISVNDPLFKGFGEAYFSSIGFECKRGWKMHTMMHMNLFVPSGAVHFCFYDESLNSRSLKIGSNSPDYASIYVPPRIWFAFEGLSSSLNLLCNISSIPHSESEVIRQPIDFLPFLDK